MVGSRRLFFLGILTLGVLSGAPETRTPDWRPGVASAAITPQEPIWLSGGALRAILVGYACHATVLNIYQISGDWPGYAQEEIEKAHPGAIALFMQGCGADKIRRRWSTRITKISDRASASHGSPLAAAGR